MKKSLSLSLLSLLLFVSGCSFTDVNDDPGNHIQDDYKINYTTAALTMGEELDLAITNNGEKVDNITWSSSDTQLARVDATGKVKACFFTNEDEVITITGQISETESLECKLTIYPRTESIFTRCYYDSENVNQDEDGHVIYMFVHAGIEANGTIDVTKTFEYDSYTNICKIVVIKHFVDNGVDAYYAGTNKFYWGDYRNGLFYGQYSEVFGAVENDAIFTFQNIGFDSDTHTIFLSTSTTYKIEESSWSTITDEAMVAKGAFYRVQECSEYAEEKFQQYNFGIHLF